MEHIVDKKETLSTRLLPALIILGMAFVLVTIVYGVDSFIAGAHDTFHDFRHVIGFPCH